jgi:hypothetical protein
MTGGKQGGIMSNRMPWWKVFALLIGSVLVVVFALIIQFVLTLPLILFFGWTLHVMFSYGTETRIASK